MNIPTENPGDLNTFFSRKDFKCKCGKCRHEAVDIDGLTILTATRLKFGKCNLRSANRCPEHNKKAGGHENSFHLYGLAWDVSFESGTPEDWAQYIYLRYSPAYLDIIIHRSFIHIEIDNHK